MHVIGSQPAPAKMHDTPLEWLQTVLCVMGGVAVYLGFGYAVWLIWCLMVRAALNQ